MLPERPQLGSLACPACGREVDALRAPRVVWMDSGPRFLCGERCQERFALGERPFDARSSTPTPTPSAPRPSIPDLVREATQTRDSRRAEPGSPHPGRPFEPFVAFGLAALALAFIGLSDSRELGWIGAFLIVLCAAVNARVPLRVVKAPTVLQWAAPAGLAISTLSVFGSHTPAEERWALLLCAGAAILLSLRNAFHAWANGAVARAGRELRSSLPESARIPSEQSPAYEEVSADALRAGDLAVVLEGERLPADGVVEEGDARVLLYPHASRSEATPPGGFLLAGTRVTEGALTIRVQRCDRDRAVVRLLELHPEATTSRSRMARARRSIGTWGWAACVVVGVAVAATSGVENAGVALLGFPVLASIASFDAPLDAAARAAARRGMFFGGASALLESSRVRTTAILLRGALTAGEPIVQQVQSLGRTDVDAVLALAAAAERMTPDHPIARALLAYANQQALATAIVRKEQVQPGLGITAVTTGGVSLVVGRRQLLLNEGISVATADDEATHIENEGLTPIFVAVDGNLEALVAILDPTHVGAPDAVRRISELPSEVVILSGDDRRTVERIAEQLGASNVKAPLLPEERALEVRALRETGGVTAAVGRGGADDAVLAAADVPVSLRLAGTATERRGVVAATGDVRDAAGALWIARAARRSILRASGAAFAVLVVVITGASMGWLSAPLAAALGIGAELWALRAGSRLLRRVDLRVPMRQ